jgi:cysteinyl-tRNA synthetase
MPEKYFAGQRMKFLQAKGLKEEEIQSWIDEREAARKAKEWARADEIRAQAASRGIILEDGPKGTTWRPTSPS